MESIDQLWMSGFLDEVKKTKDAQLSSSLNELVDMPLSTLLPTAQRDLRQLEAMVEKRKFVLVVVLLISLLPPLV